jgi:hypothetical protein
MDPITQQIALASAGASAGDSVYVDDVFSNYLWSGDGTNARNIVNGIDLSGEGGLVWLKSRTNTESHNIYDTERGAMEALFTESTAAEGNYNNRLTAFNNNGFRVNSDDATNKSGTDYCSWTFRKAPGFFDVVTWTGDGVAGRSISHNLECTPGFIFVKNTSATSNWVVYHRSLNIDDYVLLNFDNAASSVTTIWNSTSPTSTHFTVGNSYNVNRLNDQYVAYVFAHDEPVFGTNENESIIKCGKYESVYQTDVNVNLGFEPQWLLIKNVDANNHDWFLYDPMRGLTHDYDGGNTAKRLIANGGGTEAASSGIELNSTGFKIQGTNPSGLNTWGSGVTNRYIYVAIRRSHKPPSSGTNVFTPVFSSTHENRYASTGWTSQSGFPTDTIWTKPETTTNWVIDSRLIESYMKFNLTDVEVGTSPFGFDTQDGVKEGSDHFPSNGVFFADWHFKRAAGFHDVVLYDGDGSNSHTLTHNLDAVPELIIVKRRSGGTGYWHTYVEYLGNTRGVALNTSNAAGNSTSLLWANTSPTSTQFTVGGSTHLNNSGNKYYAQLFASVPGVSKIGSYTGTGNNVDVNCGFTNGARFILIKRTDATGNWHLFDTARGISSTGNDPYYSTNDNGTQYNTDYLNPLSSGFTVKSNAPAALNASGGTFLFLAIA